MQVPPPCKAISGLGFLWYKPYPYSLYRWWFLHFRYQWNGQSSQHKSWRLTTTIHPIPHVIHETGIYLSYSCLIFYGKNVSKYTSPMDPYGHEYKGILQTGGAFKLRVLIILPAHQCSHRIRKNHNLESYNHHWWIIIDPHVSIGILT